MQAPALVVDYDPDWPDGFAAVRDHVARGVKTLVQIEHVGSTAVRGLAAKPIIDVDVVVASEDDVAPAIDALETLGYERRGDLGVAGREAFTVLPGLPYHHLYVVVARSKPHRDHVDLRDYLRTHPAARQRYATGKRCLAHVLTTDREAYMREKSLLVEELLAAARR